MKLVASHFDTTQLKKQTNVFVTWPSL